MTTTIDSWAWVEYFKGSKGGEVLEQLLNTTEELCTPSLALLEIKAKYLKENKPFQQNIEFITERTRVVDLTKEIALKAAEFKARGLHTSDAIIYATAQATNSTLLTGDAHFKNFPDVKIIGK